jgi:hypothetical protein
MTRSVFSRGARGSIIRSVQERLQKRNCYTGGLDGDFGPGTEHAMQSFQTQESLPVTGIVDDGAWGQLMNAPLPSVFERCLQLTSTFEGHGFSKAQGNWDGAWLTWGIIGFTLKHGEVGSILQEAAQADPNLLPGIFGSQAADLLRIASAAPSEQEAWANSITSGTGLIEPWRSGFQKLGEDPRVQAIQLAHAQKRYFVPAQGTAAAFNLQTELGMALCFDIHVQNGGISADARQLIAQAASDANDEPSRRVVIANAVADAALPQFQADVRSRKVTLAKGSGTVHGETFDVGNWGLGEFPVI